MLHTTTSNFINLDDPLIDFSDNNNPLDYWTLRDAVRGTQIFGGIGSGKTSGSGRMIATSFLENDFGGLVLCAKPDERGNWEEMAAKSGRTNDLIIFDENSPFQFNPFDYETTRASKGGGDSYNLVSLFMNIYQMGRNFNGEGMANAGERFWDNALKRCIKRTVELLRLADQPVSIRNMQDLVMDSQKEDERKKITEIIHKGYDTPEKYKQRNLEILQLGNYYGFCINKVITSYGKINKEEQEKQDWEFKQIRSYFNRELAGLAPKTKMIIIESFLGIAEPFLGGILKKHFSGKTSEKVKPEACFDGKIILLDFPIKNYMEAGVFAQGIYKLIWQQVMERRKFKDGFDRPVFLWVDEAQYFLSSYDQLFQTTARSCGACTVFLSQNISNYYSAIGGKNPNAKVDSLLANLSTKIFHANNDSVTNEWAAKTIGKAMRVMENFNIGDRPSAGGSKQYHYQVMPVEFSVLRSEVNNDRNNLVFDTVITVANKKWSNKKNYIKYTFKQKR